jgi:hypothetical protein
MSPRARGGAERRGKTSASASAARASPVAAPETADSQEDPAVVAYLDTLDHPRKEELATLRRILLGVSPEIRESIKWNAPSFRTTDHFATMNVHARDRVRLILHTGAKVKDSATRGLEIEDPGGILEWLAKDRCIVTFVDAKDVEAKREALEGVVRAWIRQL